MDLKYGQRNKHYGDNSSMKEKIKEQNYVGGNIHTHRKRRSWWALYHTGGGPAREVRLS